MVSSGLENADEHYFGENNRNKQLEQCHKCIHRFNAYKVKSVAARARVRLCAYACIKATKLSPQCDG